MGEPGETKKIKSETPKKAQTYSLGHFRGPINESGCTARYYTNNFSGYASIVIRDIVSEVATEIFRPEKLR